MSNRNSYANEEDLCILNLKRPPAELLEGREYLCVVLSGELKSAEKELKESILKRISRLTQSIVAISLVNLDPIENKDLDKATAGLIRFVMALGMKKRRVVFFKCSPSLRTYLESKIRIQLEFVDNLFALRKQVQTEKSDFSKELEAIIEATQAVFQKQFGAEAKLSEAPILCAVGTQVQAEVVGMIEISANHLVGRLVFNMSNAVVTQLCEKALGVVLSPEDPDFPQIVGEISNLVLGYTKDRLNKEGYGIIQAIPKCFLGKSEDAMSLYLHKPSWLLKFEMKELRFDLYVTLEKVR